jgi:acetyl-CoA carboxylase biotin carboxyl carrier protein
MTMRLEPGDIAEILRVFADSELEELNLEIGDTRLRVSKNPGGLGAPGSSPARTGPAPAAAPAAAPVAAAVAPAPPVPAAVEADAPPDGLVELRSPLLGVFYRRPSPDQPPFVEPGSEVEATSDVCIVDVMKMFTRVQAGTSGTVAEILVEDGTLVEHGQVLMRIRPR